MKKDLIYVALILLVTFLTWSCKHDHKPCSEHHAWWHIQNSSEESNIYKLKLEVSENSSKSQNDSDSLNVSDSQDDSDNLILVSLKGILDNKDTIISGFVFSENLSIVNDSMKLLIEEIGRIKGQKLLFLKEDPCP